MAKYRPVKTCFWSDDFISSLSSNAKLLYLYFLTNERTTLCGIYSLPIRYILFETGLLIGEAEEAMKELNEKTIYYNGWIIIKNYKKHQSKSPKIKQGMEREEADIPQEIKDLAYSIDTVSIHIDKPVLILKPIPILKLKPKLKNTHTGHSPNGSLGEEGFKNVQPMCNQSTTNGIPVVEDTKAKKRKSSAKKKKVEEDFKIFWSAWPKKVKKKDAVRAFKKIHGNVSLNIIIKAVEQQKKGEQWKKDDGQFIPHPATWLNGDQWEDELETQSTEQISKYDGDWTEIELPIINP